MRVAYERGLHELADGLYAYLQPDGSWGWSNAGLIAADGTSLLVDTLFDLELTRNMLNHTDDLGPELAAYIRRIFGPFRFEGIELRPPGTTFEGRLDLTIGDRA